MDDLIAAGTINGAELNAADFQIAATVRLAMTLEDLRPLIESQAGGISAREAGSARGRGPVARQPSRRAGSSLSRQSAAAQRLTAKLYVVAASHPCFAVDARAGAQGHPLQAGRVAAHDPRPDAAPSLFPGHGPGLVLDGERMIGSRSIMHRLDEISPEPPLYPAEPEARRAVEEADLWGEETLQALARRMTWWTLRQAAPCDHLLRRGLAAAASRLCVGGLSAPDNPPRVADQRRQRRAGSDATWKSCPGHLDRVDGWIAAGTMGDAEGTERG